VPGLTFTRYFTESGKLYSVPFTFDNTNKRLVYSTPVELNFGNPVIHAFTTFDGNGLARVAFVTSNNRIYIQDSRSSVPSNLMIDLGTEPGMIDDVSMGLYDAQSVAYVRFSTGKHYSITFNSNTAVVSSRSPSVHNPDFFMTSSAFNNNYYMIDHRTGASITSPIR
jgi:hypothetical protein